MWKLDLILAIAFLFLAPRLTLADITIETPPVSSEPSQNTESPPASSQAQPPAPSAAPTNMRPAPTFAAYWEDPRERTVAMDRPNAVTLELGGRALVYSFDYDRSINDHIGIGAGISYWNAWSHHHGYRANSLVIPMYMNYYFQPSAFRGFLSGGADLVSVSNVINSADTFESGGVAGTLGGGFEYRGVDGFLFRAAMFAIAGKSFQVTIGFNVGVSF